MAKYNSLLDWYLEDHAPNTPWKSMAKRVSPASDQEFQQRAQAQNVPINIEEQRRTMWAKQLQIAQTRTDRQAAYDASREALDMELNIFENPVTPRIGGGSTMGLDLASHTSKLKPGGALEQYMIADQMRKDYLKNTVGQSTPVPETFKAEGEPYSAAPPQNYIYDPTKPSTPVPNQGYPTSSTPAVSDRQKTLLQQQQSDHVEMYYPAGVPALGSPKDVLPGQPGVYVVSKNRGIGAAVLGAEEITATAQFMDPLLWNADNPPIDPSTGRPMNFNGEVLPAGALRWDYAGNPWYGPPGIESFWRRFKSEVWTQANDATYDEYGQLESVDKDLPWYWGLPLAAKRFPYAAVSMLFSSLGEVTAIPFMTKVTSAIANLRMDSHQYTHDIVEGRLKVSDQEYQRQLKVMALEHPSGSSGPNDIPILEGEAGKAMIRTMGFTLIFQETRKAEFNRRVAAGQDPWLVAEDVKNPWLEAIGEGLFDISNYVGIGSIADAVKLGQMSKKFLSLSDEMAPLAKALDAIQGLPKEERLAKILAEDFPKAQFLTQKALSNKGVSKMFIKMAESRGILSMTAPAKRASVMKIVYDTMMSVAGEVKARGGAADDFMDWLVGMAKLGTKAEKFEDAADTVFDGLQMVMRAPSPQISVSRSGEIVQYVLNRVIGDDPVEFTRLSRAAMDEGVEAFSKFANDRVVKAIDDMFPTFADRVNSTNVLKIVDKVGGPDSAIGKTVKLVDGKVATITRKMIDEAQEIGSLGRMTVSESVLAKFHDRAQKHLYGPVNEVMANYYMGLSLRYPIRNALNNYLTAGIDEGLGAIFGPGRDMVGDLENLGTMVMDFSKKGSTGAQKAEELLVEGAGFRQEALGRGIGAVGSLQEGETVASRGLFGLRMGQNVEQHTGTKILYAAFKRTMEKMVKPGRAIPDISPLIAAGMPEDLANNLRYLIIENNYNVRKVKNVVRRMMNSGDPIEAFRTMAFLDKAALRNGRTLRQAIIDFGLEDEVTEILRTSTSKDHARSRLIELFQTAKRTAQRAAANTPTVAHPMDDMIAQIEDTADRIAGEGRLRAVRGFRSQFFTMMGAYAEFISGPLLEAAQRLGINVNDPRMRALTQYTGYGSSPVRIAYTRMNEAVIAIKNMTHAELSAIGMQRIYDDLIKTVLPGQGSIDHLLDQMKDIGAGLKLKDGATKKDLMEVIWDQYWTPRMRILHGAEADNVDAAVRALFDENPELRKLMSDADAGDGAPYVVVRREYERFLDWDTDMAYVYSKAGAPAPAPISRLSVIANRYGFATISDTGVPLDQKLLNTINHYLGRMGMPRFANLEDAADHPEAVDAALQAAADARRGAAISGNTTPIPADQLENTALYSPAEINAYRTHRERLRQQMISSGVTANEAENTLRIWDQVAAWWTKANPGSTPTQWLAKMKVKKSDAVKIANNQRAFRFQLAPAWATDQWKAWFGESKAVMQDGTPLRLHHGTHTTFDAFDDMYTDGFIYLSESRDYSKSMGKVIYDVYARIENPFDMRSLGMYSSPEEMAELMLEKGLIDQAHMDFLKENYGFDWGHTQETFATFNQLVRWNKSNGVYDKLIKNSDALGIDGYVFYDMVEGMKYGDTYPELANVTAKDIVIGPDFRVSIAGVENVPEGAIPMYFYEGVNGAPSKALWTQEDVREKSYMYFVKGYNEAMSRDETMEYIARMAREHKPSKMETIESTSWVARQSNQVKLVTNQSPTMDPRMMYQPAPPHGTPMWHEWFKKSAVTMDDGSPMPVYHGTMVDFDAFDMDAGKKGVLFDFDAGIGAHFAEDPSVANTFTTRYWSSKTDGQEHKGRVIPVYLSIQNPRIIQNDFGVDTKNVAADVYRTVFSGENLKRDPVAMGILKKWADHVIEDFARTADDETDPRLIDAVRRTLDPDLSDSVRTTFIIHYDSNLYSLGDPEGRSYIVRRYKELMKEQGYDGLRYTNTNSHETAEATNPEAWIIFDPWQAKSVFNENPTYDPRLLYQAELNAASESWYYSHAQRIIESKVTSPISGNRLRAVLKQYGVKDKEIEWLGLDDVIKEYGEKKIPLEDLKRIMFNATSNIEVRTLINENNAPMTYANASLRPVLSPREIHDSMDLLITGIVDDIWDDPLPEGWLLKVEPMGPYIGEPDNTTDMWYYYVDSGGKPIQRWDSQGRTYPYMQDIFSYGHHSMRSARENALLAAYGHRTDLQTKAFEFEIVDDATGQILPHPTQGMGLRAEYNPHTKYWSITGTQAYLGEFPTMQDAVAAAQKDLRRVRDVPKRPTRWDSITLPGGENYKEALITWKPYGQDYEQGHFDDQNIVTFVRFDDRLDEEGKRTMFIMEMQSDWNQQGMKYGFDPRMKPQVLKGSDGKPFPSSYRDLTKEDGIYHESEWGSGWSFKSPTGAEYVIDNLRDSVHGDMWSIRGTDLYYDDIDVALNALNERNRAYYELHPEDWEPYIGPWDYASFSKRTGFPENPWMDTSDWSLLATKRMIDYAVNNGYERVAFVTGPLSARIEGHQIIHDISKIEVARSPKLPTDRYYVTRKGGGREQFSVGKDHKLADYIGADMVKALEDNGIRRTRERADEVMRIFGLEEGQFIPIDMAEEEAARQAAINSGSVTGPEWARASSIIDNNKTNAQLNEMLADAYAGKWSNQVSSEVEPGTAEWGGEKLRWYYDGVLKDVIKKYIKKWGVEVIDTKIRPYQEMPSRYKMIAADLASQGINIENRADAFAVLDDADADWLRGWDEMPRAYPRLATVHSFEINNKMVDDVMRNQQPLFQSSGAAVRGAVQFEDDGKRIIWLTKNADASTLMHETFHIIRRDLPQEDIQTVLRFVRDRLGAGVGYDPTTGMFTGDDLVTFRGNVMPLYIAAEEVLASAFEQHMREGPNAADLPAWIHGPLQKFKDWFRSIYAALGDQDIVELNDEVRELFNTILRGSEQHSMVPYIQGNPPTPGQTLAQSSDALDELTRKVSSLVDTEWGKVSYANSNPDLDKKLDEWFSVAEDRMSAAKFLATQVAAAARDFALHDYRMRRGFDTVLSYLYPYHYWYTRTYVNWMRRFVEHPGMTAAYIRYRNAMEDAHAGAPDWWKYNVNTNELFGIESDHPLFFNIEQTLNPMYGLMGVDFDDPARWYNGIAKFADMADNFGPSLWPIYGMALAAGAQLAGDEEAAASWGSRLIPQTKDLRNLLSVMNVDVTKLPGVGKLLENTPFKYGDFDPAVAIFNGGVDYWDRRRAGKALTWMRDNAEEEAYKRGIPVQEFIAQLTDAANTHQGPLWDEAVRDAINYSATGGIENGWKFLPFIGSQLGLGFKPRTASDLAIDRFYTDLTRLMRTRDIYKTEEFSEQMDGLFQKYPFGQLVLLAGKDPDKREEAYAWDVLGRIPPGQREMFFGAEVDSMLLDAFYDNKGDLSKFDEADRDNFMNKIYVLGAVLAIPDDATQASWDAARNGYRQMIAQMEAQYGAGTNDKISAFYKLLGMGAEYADDAKAMLKNNPQLEEAMSFQDQFKMNNPAMAPYYWSMEKTEKHLMNEVFDRLEEKYGAETITDFFNPDPAIQKAFKKAHPGFSEEYYLLFRAYEKRVGDLMYQARDLLRPGYPAQQRPLLDRVPGMIESNIRSSMMSPEPDVYTYTPEQWAEFIRPWPYAARLVGDLLSGKLTADQEEELYDFLNTKIGPQIGSKNPYTMMRMIQRSFSNTAP